MKRLQSARKSPMRSLFPVASAGSRKNTSILVAAVDDVAANGSSRQCTRLRASFSAQVLSTTASIVIRPIPSASCSVPSRRSSVLMSSKHTERNNSDQFLIAAALDSTPSEGLEPMSALAWQYNMYQVIWWPQWNLMPFGKHIALIVAAPCSNE